MLECRVDSRECEVWNLEFVMCIARSLDWREEDVNFEGGCVECVKCVECVQCVGCVECVECVECEA